MKLFVFLSHDFPESQNLFTLNFSRVMSVLGVRLPPVHRHRQQTLPIIVPAPQL